MHTSIMRSTLHCKAAMQPLAWDLRNCKQAHTCMPKVCCGLFRLAMFRLKFAMLGHLGLVFGASNVQCPKRFAMCMHMQSWHCSCILLTPRLMQVGLSSSSNCQLIHILKHTALLAGCYVGHSILLFYSAIKQLKILPLAYTA